MEMGRVSWHERDYVDGAAVEHWQIDLSEDGAFHCKRISFRSVDAMRRAMSALALSVTLRTTHREATNAALSKSLEASTTIANTFSSAVTAVAFFAIGREPALCAAHKWVSAVGASVNSRT